MSNDELKEAFMSGSPINYTNLFKDTIKYKSISAIIYRKSKSGTVYVSAELCDDSNGVIIVPPERLSLA